MGEKVAAVRHGRVRLAEHEQHHYALSFVRGDYPLADLETLPVLTNVNGDACSLAQVLRSPVVTVAERGSHLGQRLHHNKVAFCLAPVTLERFEAADLPAWLALLRERARAEHLWPLCHRL